MFLFVYWCISACFSVMSKLCISYKLVMPYVLPLSFNSSFLWSSSFNSSFWWLYFYLLLLNWYVSCSLIWNWIYCCFICCQQCFLCAEICAILVRILVHLLQNCKCMWTWQLINLKSVATAFSFLHVYNKSFIDVIYSEYVFS